MSVIEDIVQSRRHNKAMRQPPQYSVTDGIVNNVAYLRPGADGFERMLVVPEFAGAEALFVDKKIRLVHMGYFRNPCDG